MGVMGPLVAVPVAAAVQVLVAEFASLRRARMRGVETLGSPD